MQNIVKVSKVITKIAEVFHWVGAALLACGSISALAAPQYLDRFLKITAIEGYGAPMEVYGFEVVFPLVNGSFSMPLLALFGLGGVAILVCMALAFRSLHLIIASGENGSPFRQENVKLMHQVGLCAISVPAIGTVDGAFCSLLHKLLQIPGQLETSVDLAGVFMGLLILCLTQFFAQGVVLQQDVDGLL